MSRKARMFLLGGLTLATTVLAPQAAGAVDTRPPTTNQSASYILTSDVDEGAGGARTGSLVASTRRQAYPVGDLEGFVDCPDGSHLSPFEKPIYDEDGLFVVGYETVWYCIPDDLEPAG